MSRPLPKREDIDVLIDLFRAEDGYMLLAEPGFEEDLRVALRVTLQVGLGIEEIGDDTAAFGFNIRMLRDDIGAAIEIFENIASVIVIISEIRENLWQWPDSLSWHDLRIAYSRELDLLCATPTPVRERYEALIRIVRLQLAFWGLTFGSSIRGYVG